MVAPLAMQAQQASEARAAQVRAAQRGPQEAAGRLAPAAAGRRGRCRRFSIRILPTRRVSGGPEGGGAFVTIYGLDLGAAAGQVQFAGSDLTVQSWGTEAYRGMSKIVAQIPAGVSPQAGLLRVVSAGNQPSNDLPLTTTSKKILYVSPDGSGDGTSRATPTRLSNLQAVYSAGDLVYLATGTYDENVSPCANGDDCAWAVNLTATATSSNPVQIVGYPGDVAEFNNHHDAIVVRQNYLRLANLKLHAGTYSAVVVESATNLAIVASELWTDTQLAAAVGSNGGETSFELTGNYVHNFRVGTLNFCPIGSRLVRYNQFEVIERVFEIDMMLDDKLEDYGNTATSIGLYGFLRGCNASGSNCNTPSVAPTVRVHDNLISSARYLVYQHTENATNASVSFVQNTLLDAQCAAGSNSASVAVQAALRGNILTPTRAATCTDDEIVTAATVAFDGQKNHWGSTTPPASDPDGVTGALNLDSLAQPAASSSACGGIARSAPPFDLDHLGRPRLDPTAFGAFECR